MHEKKYLWYTPPSVQEKSLNISLENSEFLSRASSQNISLEKEKSTRKRKKHSSCAPSDLFLFYILHGKYQKISSMKKQISKLDRDLFQTSIEICGNTIILRFFQKWFSYDKYIRIFHLYFSFVFFYHNIQEHFSHDRQK